MKIFNWERALSTLNMNEMISVCNTTIKNVIPTFILHETIICNGLPPWISNRIINLIHEQNSLYKDYRKITDTEIFEKLTLLQKKLHLAMEELKDTCHSTKLVKQKSNPKTYWSVLKMFLNNKKIPCIPSLFHEIKFGTDFRQKS